MGMYTLQYYSGTSIKVSLGKEMPFVERSIYTQLHVVGTCVVSVIERLYVVESAR